MYILDPCDKDDNKHSLNFADGDSINVYVKNYGYNLYCLFFRKGHMFSGNEIKQ